MAEHTKQSLHTKGAIFLNDKVLVGYEMYKTIVI